jgi:hypothetical protein
VVDEKRQHVVSFLGNGIVQRRVSFRVLAHTQSPNNIYRIIQYFFKKEMGLDEKQLGWKNPVFQYSAGQSALTNRHLFRLSLLDTSTEPNKIGPTPIRPAIMLRYQRGK